MHGGAWFMAMRSGDEKPKVTRELLLRVLTYAKPYWWHIGGMLMTILASAGLSLVTPLIFRQLIDNILPNKDLEQTGGIRVRLAVRAIAERRHQCHPAQTERNRRRRRHLRSARGALCPLATHVSALLHQHQSRRVDEPPQQ